MSSSSLNLKDSSYMIWYEVCEVLKLLHRYRGLFQSFHLTSFFCTQLQPIKWLTANRLYSHLSLYQSKSLTIHHYTIDQMLESLDILVVTHSHNMTNLSELWLYQERFNSFNITFHKEIKIGDFLLPSTQRMNTFKGGVKLIYPMSMRDPWFWTLE